MALCLSLALTNQDCDTLLTRGEFASVARNKTLCLFLAELCGKAVWIQGKCVFTFGATMPNIATGARCTT